MILLCFLREKKSSRKSYTDINCIQFIFKEKNKGFPINRVWYSSLCPFPALSFYFGNKCERHSNLPPPLRFATFPVLCSSLPVKARRSLNLWMWTNKWFPYFFSLPGASRLAPGGPFSGMCFLVFPSRLFFGNALPACSPKWWFGLLGADILSSTQRTFDYVAYHDQNNMCT